MADKKLFCEADYEILEKIIGYDIAEEAENKKFLFSFIDDEPGPYSYTFSTQEEFEEYYRWSEKEQQDVREKKTELQNELSFACRRDYHDTYDKMYDGVLKKLIDRSLDENNQERFYLLTSILNERMAPPPPPPVPYYVNHPFYKEHGYITGEQFDFATGEFLDGWEN